jgi:hypothetical protein
MSILVVELGYPNGTGAASPAMEGHMFVNSTWTSTAEPSPFYLMMAATCFRRAACTRQPGAGGALRDIGREYLAKAYRVIPTRECPPPAADRKGGSKPALEIQS